MFVIGMHRSGTTMVTQALERLGVFMGANLLHNAENELVVRLNDWLLWQASAAWDRPEPFRELQRNEPVRALSVDYLRFMLGSPRSAPMVGRERALKGGTVLKLDGRWGLKDPRMTYTLPLWLELWPDARVVSVTRHGVDVAASLHVRAERKVTEYSKRYERLRRGYLLKPKHTRMAKLVPTVRCTTLEGAFGLWDEYDTELERRHQELGDRVLHLRYEDFLDDPSSHVRRLADFCGLPMDRSAAQEIDAGRKFAFAARPELRAFAERADVAAALERHGYRVAASV